MRWYCFILGLVLFFSCQEEQESLPDISGISVDMPVERFEQSLSAASLDSLHNGAQALRSAYPIFFDSVWLQVMLPGKKEGYDSALVAAFRVQPVLARLLDSVGLRYPANQQQKWEADLLQGFKYAKAYFPQKPTPRVITYVSELALGNFTYGEEMLGIGLDFFLGEGFEGYDPNVFPRYIQRSMNADHIAPKSIEAWVSGIMGEGKGDRMIDRMIHNGKLMYIKDRLLPHMADTAVLGFSESQLSWLKDNEDLMWAHYLDKELLYETQGSLIGKHVGPSPNAPGMPQEAPGGGANWVGMRIIQQYMARRPDQNLQDLINEQDAQTILAQSKYKPPKR